MTLGKVWLPFSELSTVVLNDVVFIQIADVVITNYVIAQSIEVDDRHKNIDCSLRLV